MQCIFYYLHLPIPNNLLYLSILLFRKRSIILILSLLFYCLVKLYYYIFTILKKD